MRVVKTCRTVLNRQVSEAVRIGRREGDIGVLNSKTEYNQCHIARLRVEDETEKREEYIRTEEEQLAEELDREQRSWEQGRTHVRDKERRRTAVAFGSTDVRLRGKKTRKEEPPGSNRKPKRRNFALLEEDL